MLRNLAWAETIVKAEITSTDALAHLRSEIQKFPTEFLLFLQVPLSLTLDDGANPVRTLRIESRGEERSLYDGEQVSRWRVIVRDVSIQDQAARQDATHIHQREHVPLSWALPLEVKQEKAGAFWAFFPTKTPTFLSGIFNAPWKLNSDRNSIISGPWNTALMREAASLIVGTLPSLATVDDPGRLIDAFPRQPEPEQVAAPLVEAVWAAIKDAEIIPDANGKRRKSGDLWRHPWEKEGQAIAGQWQALARSETKSQFVHSSCLKGQRDSRLKELSSRLQREGGDAKRKLRFCHSSTWFNAIISDVPDTAKLVLKLVETCWKHCRNDTWKAEAAPGIFQIQTQVEAALRQLAIIPTVQHGLKPSSDVVLAPEGANVIPGMATPLIELTGDAETRRILVEVLKVRQLDDNTWQEILTKAIPKNSFDLKYDQQNESKWLSLWVLIRSAPPEVARTILTKNKSRVPIRRCDRRWAFPDSVLRPGVLVGLDDQTASAGLLVDEVTHGQDGEWLTLLGVAELPKGTVGPGEYSTVIDGHDELDEWLSTSRSNYLRQVDGRPKYDYLAPRWLALPLSWHLLPALDGNARARFTEHLVKWMLGQPQPLAGVTFGHTTSDRYQDITIPHPILWFVLKHGTWKVGVSIVKLSAIAARRGKAVMRKLPNWALLLQLLPQLATVNSTTQPTEDDISEMWNALELMLVTPESIAGDTLLDLWIAQGEDNWSADHLGPLSEVYVTTSPDLARRVRTENRIVVTLDEKTMQLWLKDGACDLSSLISVQYDDSETGPADLLTSIFPEFGGLNDDNGSVLKPELVGTAIARPVVALAFCIDDEPEPTPCLFGEGALLVDLAQLYALPRHQRLECLLAEMACAGWLRCSAQDALLSISDARADEQRAKVAAGASLAERLLLAVGHREEPLLKLLGDLADKPFLENCNSLQLAELVLAQLGPTVLVKLTEVLRAEGLKPPGRWNTAEARAFVDSIGFPAGFAESPESRREPEEYISGPIELKPLHDFQEEVYEGVRELLNQSSRRRRAVVCLPTGGGKTRVIVEAAVRQVLAPMGERRFVLWIAQTDELCEQAVQAFRQVWLNLGAQRTNLRIVRFWGGHPNPAVQDTSLPIVIVANIQTMSSRMEAIGEAWKRQLGLVVIDECHHAIASSYTSLLHWLDAQGAKPEVIEPPIIGLSATPIRMNNDESAQLARRFDERLLPNDQSALHDRLRRQGVLSEVDYETLESVAQLLSTEVSDLNKLADQRKEFEFDRLIDAISQRLGNDAQRNALLVDYIRQAQERSILLFTNSVSHAAEMSARLNLAGISAAAISGETPKAAKRYFLDRFQRGDIRVLCNYSVLTTGFDAPKTDMVIISRLVFSRVRYMQMVGRGLRGEKNGGTARCRIVTVLDNLGRFNSQHAYHYCQRYFDPTA